MNERIQELASQSNFNWFLSSGNLSTNNTIHDLEKFAELIILECASLFPRTFTDERYQRRIDSTIRKHFGVEQ